MCSSVVLTDIFLSLLKSSYVLFFILASYKRNKTAPFGATKKTRKEIAAEQNGSFQSHESRVL